MKHLCYICCRKELLIMRSSIHYSKMFSDVVVTIFRSSVDKNGQVAYFLTQLVWHSFTGNSFSPEFQYHLIQRLIVILFFCLLFNGFFWSFLKIYFLFSALFSFWLLAESIQLKRTCWNQLVFAKDLMQNNCILMHLSFEC